MESKRRNPRTEIAIMFCSGISNLLKASLNVVEEEFQIEAEERANYNEDDACTFITSVLPPIVLSAINNYPTKLASSSQNIEDAAVKMYREEFRELVNSLQYLVSEDIARASSGRILLSIRDKSIIPIRMTVIEIASISIASSVIDWAFRSSKEADFVFVKALCAILRYWDEYYSCEEIAQETVRIIRVLSSFLITQNGIISEYSPESFEMKMKIFIEENNLPLKEEVMEGTELKTTYKLCIEAFYRVICLSERSNILKRLQNSHTYEQRMS